MLLNKLNTLNQTPPFAWRRLLQSNQLTYKLLSIATSNFKPTVFSLNPNLRARVMRPSQLRYFFTSSVVSFGEGYELEKIRNIGIIAHIDAGKTTTTERMLFYAGFTRKIGDVDTGNTVMDYLKQERERGITIQSAAITFRWKLHRINLIDTPGHVDFTMEVERSIRVLDGAVTILDGVAGVEAQTETVWAQADRYKLPRIIFVNKLDRMGADFDLTVEQIQTRLGGKPLICQVPVFSPDTATCHETITGVLDVISMKHLEFPDANTMTCNDITETSPIFQVATKARETLVEAVAENDDVLMEIYLDLGDAQKVPASDLHSAIRRITLGYRAVPVLCGASLKNLGVQPLLDAITYYLPSPADRPLPIATQADGRNLPVPLSQKGPLSALAFKVIYDKQRGPLTFVRVYSGSLQRSPLVNSSRQGLRERPLKLLQMYADDYEEIQQIEAGNIGIVLGLKGTHTGDTLQEPGKLLTLPGLPLPEPVFMCSVEPDTSADEPALTEALNHLVLEDPSLRVFKDPDSGQTLLGGMGELHLEIVRDRLINDLNIKAKTGKVFISYRETFLSPLRAKLHYRSELLGRSVQAEIKITVSLLDSSVKGPRVDGNVIFIDSKVTPSRDTLPVPFSSRDIVSSIKSGLNSAISRGGPYGFPFVKLHILVSELKSFGKETTLGAFSMCAYQCFTNLVRTAQSNQALDLLEPRMKVVVQASPKYMGTVLSDLSGVRLANIVSLDSDSNGGRNRVIVAQVPLSSLIGYSSTLRSLTAGTSSFTMQQDGHCSVPAHQVPSNLFPRSL